MSTVADLIERLYRQYLYPPDYEPALVQLASDITTEVQTTFTLGEFAVPEDEELLRISSLIEIDRELMRVQDYNINTKEVTVKRGERSTPTGTYTAGEYFTLTPSYNRQSVFEAVRDNIITLYPRVSQVKAIQLTTVGWNVAGLEDTLAVEVIEVWQGDWASSQDWDARIVDFHPTVGGRAVITNGLSGTFWIRYRRRMGVATNEEEVVDDLGVDPTWENIVLIGAAADMLVGRDIPQALAEYVGAVIQAENIQVGTRASIAVSLARYRVELLRRAEDEMKSEYGVKVHMNSPFGMVTRGSYG